MATEIVTSDCSVEILGRSGLIYREGSRTMHIDGEMLTGPKDFVVYVKSIVSWDGSDDSISEVERRKIVSNLRVAFEQHEMNVDFA